MSTQGNVYDVLMERGFIEQATHPDEIRELLGKESVTFYIGFDATADSLTAGHFLTIMAMMHMQRAGHRPIALLGGGTTMIGDPSGKSDMRNMMTKEKIDYNAKRFAEQLGRFIDFDDDHAVIANNADWLLDLNYVEFLREIGVHFSVNKMLTAECYKQRMEKGLTFFEFNYMLMQSYDFWKLNKEYGCTMELGGNAPFIVFEDADIPAAVEGAYAAKMRNMGEACTAANRIIVHEDVAEEFTRAFVERMEATVVGDGAIDGTECGPLIQPSAVESMLFMVEDALGKGALLACGGYIPELDSKVYGNTGGMPRNLNKGNFIRPTVLTGVTDSMRVWREEIFGPVAPIATFSGYGEEGERAALKLANDTEYGLAAYVYTSNHPRFTRMAAGLEFGLIGYNSGVISNAAAPFGGVKQSGMGREGGPEGLEEYTELQYIGAPNPFAG